MGGVWYPTCAIFQIQYIDSQSRVPRLIPDKKTRCKHSMFHTDANIYTGLCKYVEYWISRELPPNHVQFGAALAFDIRP